MQRSLTAYRVPCGRLADSERASSPTTTTSPRRTSPRSARRRLAVSPAGRGKDLARWLRRASVEFGFPSRGTSEGAVKSELQALLDHDDIHLTHVASTWERPAFGRIEAPEGPLQWKFSAQNLAAPQKVQGVTDMRDHFMSDFRAHGVFWFRAERMNVGEGTAAAGQRLSNNAVNLAQVLHDLQSRDPAVFAEFCAAVRRVLPSVGDVRVPLTGNRPIEIRIWPHQTPARRDDLAVSLRACGTGVSQVLAMVYVVLTAEEPITLLIDEPNSFLHPSAVSELMKLFREHSQHQYVVATHSPEVIAEFDPDLVYQLDLADGETAVTAMDAGNIEHQRRILEDVGVRLSTVFGADRILWVEGHTEELAFPLIVGAFSPDALVGCRILRVDDTGSFERRRAASAVNLYERLAKGAALVPPAVGFLLDRETLDTENVRRLRDRVPTLHFLKRRMTECYLLHPRAIAAVLTEDVGNEIDPASVEHELAARRPLNDAAWWAKANAAKELAAVFKKLGGEHAPFTKPGVSARLTRWLVVHDREHLRPLFEEIHAVLQPRAPDARVGA